MTMQIEIPDEVADKLKKRAEATGTEAETLVIHAVMRTLEISEGLRESLAETRAAFDESGMSEDELTEMLEEEKHAMRRGA